VTPVLVEAKCPVPLAESIASIAKADGVSRSEVVRTLLAVGLVRLAEPLR